MFIYSGHLGPTQGYICMCVCVYAYTYSHSTCIIYYMRRCQPQARGSGSGPEPRASGYAYPEARPCMLQCIAAIERALPLPPAMVIDVGDLLGVTSEALFSKLKEAVDDDLVPGYMRLIHKFLAERTYDMFLRSKRRTLPHHASSVSLVAM